MRPFNKVLLDPPRSGALFALPYICRLQAEKILYVSCNPVTAARDCQRLHAEGYRLTRWGLFDMFPHTGHLESMVLFERM